MIQNWNVNVRPSIPNIAKSNTYNKKCIEYLKWWIKSWFFDTESECEYLFSRHLFFSWLESLRGILGDIFIEIVVHWIKTKLDPFESMALNYKRLHICGMNARTTSTAESMHSSMKHGINKVFSSDSTSTSAAKMMDKSILKGNEIFRCNAQELTRHCTANHSLRGTYLTDYAYKYAENEYELSKKCGGIKISNTEYHVYTKDDI